MLPLPELRQLQEHVIRVEHRHEQAGGAVLDAAAQDVVAEKRQRRVDEGLEGVRPAPFREPLLGRERRVAIDRRKVMRDVAVREVLQLVSQHTRLSMKARILALQFHRLGTRRLFHPPARRS